MLDRDNQHLFLEDEETDGGSFIANVNKIVDNLIPLQELNDKLTPEEVNNLLNLADNVNEVGGNLPVVASGSTEARKLSDRFSDVVNVKDFGAVGDGITDDTAAFEKASIYGNNIFCPKGIYVINRKPELPQKSIHVYTLGNVDISGDYGKNLDINSERGGIQISMMNTGGKNDKTLYIKQSYEDSYEYHGKVESSIYTRTDVSSEHQNRVWGIVGIVRSKAYEQKSQIVGGYFQGWRASENAQNSVWGSVSEARDTSDTGASGAIMGTEIDCVANGSCEANNWNRVGALIVGMSQNGETGAVHGSGIRITSNNTEAGIPQSKWHYGIQLSKTFNFGIYASNATFDEAGIDFSKATFTKDIALRLAIGSFISFANNDVIKFGQKKQSTALFIDFNNVSKYMFYEDRFAAPNLNMPNYSITGNIQEGKTISTSPNKLIEISVSGTKFWIPAFSI